MLELDKWIQPLRFVTTASRTQATLTARQMLPQTPPGSAAALCHRHAKPNLPASTSLLQVPHRVVCIWPTHATTPRLLRCSTHLKLVWDGCGPPVGSQKVPALQAVLALQGVGAHGPNDELRETAHTPMQASHFNFPGQQSLVLLFQPLLQVAHLQAAQPAEGCTRLERDGLWPCCRLGLRWSLVSEHVHPVHEASCLQTTDAVPGCTPCMAMSWQHEA